MKVDPREPSRGSQTVPAFYRSVVERPQPTTNALVIGTAGLAVTATLAVAAVSEQALSVVPAVEVLFALATVAAAACAYLQLIRGRVTGDERLEWVGWGFAAATVCVVLNALSIRGFAPTLDVLSLSSSGAAALYLGWHAVLPLYALGGLLGWSRHVRRWFAVGVAVWVALSVWEPAVLRLPELVRTDRSYTPTYRGLLLATAVFAGVCALAWVVRTGRHACWPDAWTGAALVLLAGDIGLNVAADRYFAPLWWASMALRLLQFLVPAIGLQTGFVRLFRTLQRSERSVVERLNRELQLAYEVTGEVVEDRRAMEQAFDRVDLMLANEQFGVVFQPIYDLVDGRLVGVEALSRFHAEPHQPPDRWFADAQLVGRGVELEAAAVRAALMQLPSVPDGVYLSLNVSPDTLVSRQLAEVLEAVDGERLVLEITEHAPVENYLLLAEAMSRYERRGVRLAVDDAGAGFASLRHIVRLGPAIIKLDVSLTRDLHLDPIRASLAAALTGFARSSHVGLVAEGIETEGELDALHRLGVPCGQGFLLSRPSALALVPQGIPGSLLDLTPR
ncbi:MAG TPA: EAL domain-containing protein [Nitriliruptorales bacterium]|nr:EAL domain-containing protein [Nitriliruptorales bacterium]